MLNILILCTGNSCRSQMAEGYLRNLGGPNIQVYSAGLEAHGVNPRAIAAMKEEGIDISNHTSNLIDDFKTIPFDYVITVCDNANEKCPYFSTTAKRLHQNFPDPAKATGSEEAVRQAFRQTRDQIKNYCLEFINILKTQ